MTKQEYSAVLVTAAECGMVFDDAEYELNLYLKGNRSYGTARIRAVMETMQ